MTKFCELCGLDALEPAYGQDTANGSTVYICPHCGLTQSHRGAIAQDAIASFGVHGESAKNLRVTSTLALIRDHVDLSLPISVLDVGAARGAFVREFLSAAPRATVTAVEPNKRQAWACAFLNRSDVISKPIEETYLPGEHFDVVHSCRTIEHLDSPLAVLSDHWRVLKPGGLLILDSRNIGAIREEAIVDEWFTSNFRCHFSSVTLSRMLNAAGFDLTEPSDSDDRENILIAAVKSDCAKRNILADPLEVRSARALISFYKSARRKNLSALGAVVAELTTLAPRGIAICGSGRLLDSLVRHGGLDQKNFLFFSEARLGLKPALHQGAAGNKRLELEDANPGVIVVMSDAHTHEIARIASRFAPQAEVIHYSELVFRAYDRLAA
jgi:SAM-dependent methyltransferase